MSTSNYEHTDDDWLEIQASESIFHSIWMCAFLRNFLLFCFLRKCSFFAMFSFHNLNSNFFTLHIKKYNVESIGAKYHGGSCGVKLLLFFMREEMKISVFFGGHSIRIKCHLLSDNYPIMISLTPIDHTPKREKEPSNRFEWKFFSFRLCRLSCFNDYKMTFW